MAITHLTTDELDAGLEHIRRSPRDNGALRLIVRRPGVGQRETLTDAELSTAEGLVGDTWKRRAERGADGVALDHDTQLNVMNARAIALIAGDESRWPLAGDQLYIDLDLSEDNLPPGTQLAIGGAVIEITAEPHTGCSKFVSRFGMDATRWVNSPVGKALHLRGLNARVVQSGPVRVGDLARKR